MGKICVECEDPSWTGQDPIQAPELPVDGGGVKVVDELPEKGQKGMAYVLVDDIEAPTTSQGIFVYDEGWILTAQPVSEAVQMVEELPEEGQLGVLYYVPKTGDDTYDLYRWVDDSWIKVDVDVKLYGSTGQNTDGAMTQKATSDAISASLGKVKVLTSDDYNWNYDTRSSANPNCVALWLLDNGLYRFDSGVVGRYANGNQYYTNTEAVYMITPQGIYGREILALRINYANGNPASYGNVYRVSAQNGSMWESFGLYRPADDLTTTSSDVPLSAKQGKILNDKIEGRVITGAGAPTTSTVGTVGKIYEDTTNGKLYICTAIVPGTDPDPDTYTWEEVGGDQLIPLTTADYVSNQIRAWLLEPGFYVNADSVNLTFAPCNTVSTSLRPGKVFYVGGADYAGYKDITVLSASTGTTWDWYTVNASTGVAMFQYHIPKNVVNNLTSTSTTEALSANQGKVLKDTIDQLTAVNFTAENSIEFTDNDENSMGFVLGTDAETGEAMLYATNSEGNETVYPSKDYVDSLVGDVESALQAINNGGNA